MNLIIKFIFLSVFSIALPKNLARVYIGMKSIRAANIRNLKANCSFFENNCYFVLYFLSNLNFQSKFTKRFMRCL